MKLLKKNTYDGFRCAVGDIDAKTRRHLFVKGQNFKPSLNKILQVIYEWSRNTKIKRIREETELSYKQIHSILSVIRLNIGSNKVKKIGGQVCVVEIDETAITKR